MLPLQPVGQGAAVSLSPATTQTKEAGGGGSSPFEKLLAQASEDQSQSDVAVRDLVTGKNDDVQQVVMQVVKAEMSFQLFMEVRNQVIESYNELMRMQF